MNKDTELIWESYIQGRLDESGAIKGKIPFKVHVRINKSIRSADPEAAIKKYYGANYVRDIDVSENPANPGHYDIEFTYVSNYPVENPSSAEDVKERLKGKIGDLGRIIAIYDVYSNTNLFGQDPEQQKKPAAAPPPAAPGQGSDISKLYDRPWSGD